jgi:hypothetical protein
VNISFEIYFFVTSLSAQRKRRERAFPGCAFFEKHPFFRIVIVPTASLPCGNIVVPRSGFLTIPLFGHPASTRRGGKEARRDQAVFTLIKRHRILRLLRRSAPRNEGGDMNIVVAWMAGNMVVTIRAMTAGKYLLHLTLIDWCY